MLDENMTEEEADDLRGAEAVCRRFLTWDLEDERERVQRDGEDGILGGKHDSKVRGRLEEVLGETEGDE